MNGEMADGYRSVWHQGDTDRKAMKSYRLQTEDIRRDLYLLLAVFCASPTLSSIGADEGFAYVNDLRKSFEDTEVVNRLIRISVSIRILDARFRRKFPIANSLLSVVGELTPDINGPRAETLSLRESCNKIVHAEEYHLEREDVDCEHSHINPIVLLTGVHREKHWSARINIKEFSREAFHSTHAILARVCE